VTLAAWESWRPDEYFRDYYSQGVAPDEQAAIQFQIAFLRRSSKRFSRAVEYGCGPTQMRALAASAYVESLDMADRLEGNLAHVRRWAAGDPQADDWSHFAEYVLRCEGITAPSREDVLVREQRTRRVLTKILRTDARKRHPLGQERVGTYDLLISGFCLDCLSQSKAVWRRCMRNVFGLLEPGGSFVLLALRGCKGYRVGDRWFPGANIQLSDWKAELLSCHADVAHLEVAEHELPSHVGQGYAGILLACGRTSV
jgi:hypothetical protein